LPAKFPRVTKDLHPGGHGFWPFPTATKQTRAMRTDTQARRGIVGVEFLFELCESDNLRLSGVPGIVYWSPDTERIGML